jgi:hypothetical protein
MWFRIISKGQAVIKKLLMVVGVALLFAVGSPLTASASSGNEPACPITVCW